MQSGKLCSATTFMSTDDERLVPRSFDLEQTIDMLERRQEAAVLRHLRQINTTTSMWELDSRKPISELTKPSEQLRSSQFRNLSKAQIAEVMAGEQRLLESRIQRSRSMKQKTQMKRDVIASSDASEGV